MEHQIAAQRDAPGLAVVLADCTLGHLRLRPVVTVEAEQRIEDQEAMVTRLIGRRPHRIEHRQVGLGDELQDLRSFAAGKRGRGESGSGGGEKRATAHGAELLALGWSPAESDFARAAVRGQAR